MTRVGSDRILKYANGNISDHIHNHIHLTNCIHLKNHMHRHSPMLGDNSLMRDLVVLQRSRSLRDPSASPPSWHSPLDADMTLKHVEKDAVVCDGTKSVAVERPRNGRRLSGGSPCIAVLSSSKVAPGEIIGGAAVSHLSTKSRLRGGKRINREASGSKSIGGDSLGGSEVPPVSVNQEDNELPPDAVSKNHVPKDKMSRHKARHRQDNLLKTLSEQLKDAPMDSDGVVSSHVHLHGRHNRKERTVEDPETSSRRSLSGLNRVNKRRMRGAKRTGASVSLRDVGAHSEFSVASNSLAQGSENQRYQLEEGEGNFAEQCVTRASKNSCGIPWNWSRIHHRGRTILDIAGRSFSCGTSDSRSKKGGLVPRQKDVLNIPTESDGSSSYAKSEAEALPLLVEASGSQVSSDNAVWARDYSGGEIGIFAERLLNPDNASDVASEARFIERVKFRGHRHGRHRSLTQKYMPRTFTDLVGQNLVAQALTNAIVKRKVGLLYVFYGPHGTGKTSCARIFARALNCQSLDHPKPCGLCNSCTAQNTGKSSSIREVGPVSNFDMETIMDLLDNMSVSVSQRPLQFRVMIFDDCDSLTPDCWSSISKVIDRAPRRVVFVLVSSNLDHLPHMIISRCQKFFFPKLKDADITYTLQWISTKESLEIDKDALKLIASRSDGSLRDAEMTLEQLSLLGQRISVPLVQELVGLICDEKLVDLLDLALSADTVNTVKNLREIMETSVDPLALMSQLATVITDILAGSYDFNKERFRRKFFRRPTLSKEDMEKLRQALKTLSEAEKQLRMSNDKLTWLTAALLQLAPDQQYMLPSSFVDPTFNHSPSVLNNVGGRDASRRSSAHHEDMPNNERALSSPNEIYNNGKMRGTGRDGKMPSGAVSFSPQMSTLNPDMNRLRNQQMSGKIREEIEEIWLEVLRKIQSDNIREFICNEGKLGSVRFDGAPTTVQLMFDSHMNKAKAEEFQGDILQAFESVLESPVVLEIRCEVGKDKRLGANVPPVLPSTDNSSSQMVMRSAGYNGINKWALKQRDANGAGATPSHTLNSDVVGIRSEIVEIAASPRELKCSEPVDNTVRSHLRSSVSSWPREIAGSSYKKSATVSHRGRKATDINRSHSLVRGKVSLAHVLQQAEGRTRNGWSKRKAVSIAEKLEQENLRLEPSSRCLGCWKASRVTRQKLSRLKFRMRPRSLLKFVSCGRCLSSKSRR